MYIRIYSIALLSQELRDTTYASRHQNVITLRIAIYSFVQMAAQNQISTDTQNTTPPTKTIIGGSKAQSCLFFGKNAFNVRYEKYKVAKPASSILAIRSS